MDMDTGAIVAVTTHGGAEGDTASVGETLPAAGETIAEHAEKRTCTSGFCCKRLRATWPCCSGRWLEWGRREQCTTQRHIYCLFSCSISRPWTP